MTKMFTPGPWEIIREELQDFEEVECGLGFPRIIGPISYWEGIVECREDSAEIDEANAQLIAAAPDMFSVLEALLPSISAGERAIVSELLTKICEVE